ncbi:protein kinase, partial [Linderina macrospora]
QRDGDHHGGLSEIKVTGKLQAQNAQFQAEIAAIDPVETEDPLDVYYRYIQWLFEVFPQATGHQAIIKLVETPLTLFRGQERYRNDARYVKMWIWYTGLINDGQEAVFQYLLSNKIGDSLAVLYEEYAKLLESREKIPRADKVFQLGIARKAQPLARLERRHVDFQRRVMMLKKFTVFCDDTGDAYSAASTQGSPATEPAEILSSALTPRRDRSKAAYTTAESFLRSFTDTDTPSTSRHQPKRGKDKPKQRMGKNPEKMVMPADMLFPHGDDVPQCVEEARAQLSRYAFDYDAWCANERIEAEAIEAECRAAAAAAAAANLESVSLQQNKITVHDNKDDDDDDDDDDEDLDDESASPSFLGKRKAAAISSPTINTRAAREGMLEIWNDVSDSDSESLDG